MVVPLRKLRKGAYTVRWHITSNEGHVISGVYTFGCRVKPPPPTEAYGAGGPTKFEYVAKWGYFVGLALLVGGLAFRLLVLRGGAPSHRALERRFYWIVGAGVVGSIELGILGFILRAADAFQLPLDQLIYGDLSPLARGTRFGTAFIAMTLGFALVAAFLFLAWLHRPDDPALARVRPRAPALFRALALGALGGGRRVIGGSRSSPTTCTSSAACFWVGGLVHARVRRVADGAGPAARGVPPLLAASGRARRSDGARRRVSRVRERLPAVFRSLAGPLRAGAADQELLGRARAFVGRATPLRRSTGAGNEAEEAAREPSRAACEAKARSRSRSSSSWRCRRRQPTCEAGPEPAGQGAVVARKVSRPRFPGASLTARMRAEQC